MGKAADRACIQFRVLNRGKGPAVHSLRAQADRRKYQELMKHTLEQQKNLDLKQAMITEVRLNESGSVGAVVTQLGAVYPTRAVVICTGTYLSSRVITGECYYASGPDGMHAAIGLSDSLRALGLSLRRFKTGTPPRVNRRSIDFSKMEVQPATMCPCPLALPPGTFRRIAPSAISRIPTRKPIGSSGRIFTAVPCSPASLRASAPVLPVH